MRAAIVALLAVVTLSGCHLLPTRTVYLAPPEAYLQPCAVPPLPADTGDLSAAFVVAAQCAKQGNDDKAAIRAHIESRGRR